MRDIGNEKTLVLRASWQRRLVSAVSPLVGVILIQGFVIAGDRRAWNPSDVIFGAVIWAALVWFTLVMQSRNRLELRPGELYVRSGWRKSTAPASEIQRVTVEHQLGSRLVTVWLRGGGKRRLPSAGRTEGLVAQHFDRDLQIVTDWWTANRDYAADQNRLAYGPIADFNWHPLT